MKKLIYVLCWFWGIGGVLAQPTIQWQKCLGGSQLDEAKSSQQTSDGGYIVAGFAASSNGDVVGNHGTYDVWVCKFSAQGVVQWKKAYGGTNGEWAYSIQQTSDGGYILAGFTLSNNGNVSGYHGDSDAWVVKLSATGVLEWQKCLGGSAHDEAWSVVQTSDGGYAVAGRSNSTDGDATENHGGYDFWVVKLNGLGVVEWQKSLGGSAEDTASAIKQTEDGGYIVVGESLSENGDVSNNYGDGDYWVVKLSPIGDIEWEKALGGGYSDRANDVIQALDGGYMVVGHASSGNGNIPVSYGSYDIWVVKLTPQGEIQWEKSLGGSKEDWGQSIQQTTDGGYLVAGGTSSTDYDLFGNERPGEFWLVKIDSLGQIQWGKTLGGSMGEIAYSANQTSDGGYFICGKAWSTDGDASGNHGKSDFWVVKLSPNSTPTTTPSTETHTLTLSPNPAQKNLSIQTQEPGKTDIQIYNLLGQALQHQSLEMSDLGAAQVDISQLPRGLYLITATGASGQVYSGRFLKGE